MSTEIRGSASTTISSTSHCIIKTLTSADLHDRGTLSGRKVYKTDIFSAPDEEDLFWEVEISVSSMANPQVKVILDSLPGNCIVVEVWKKFVSGIPSPSAIHREGAEYSVITNSGSDSLSSSVPCDSSLKPQGINFTYTLCLWYTKLKNMGSVALQAAYQNSHRERESNGSLSKNLIGLLDSASGDSDVSVVSSSGRQWKLHKCVLRARSPVFEAMFSHDMIENAGGVVNVRDAEDEALDALIRFLYSDSFDHVDGYERELLALAEQYQVATLKKKCEEILSRASNMNVENAIELCIFAARYNAKILLKAVAHFVSKNFEKICSQVKWARLVEEETELANEIILLMCSD